MDKQNKIIAGLVLVSLICLVAAYFAPIWWVSLTAPNYPKDAFPDGIRIHFHFDNVYNGCKAARKGTQMASEIIQKDLSHEDERYNPILDGDTHHDKDAEGLDCVHEMNTINHYVGMFPIATGAPVEKPLAKFFFGFFAVMMLAFAASNKKARIIILSLGFTAVASWMLIDQFGMGKLDAHVKHYMEESGAFFKEPERIKAWGDNVYLITQIAIFGLIACMAFIVVAVSRIRGFQLVLAFVPALLPLYFLVTYSAWLWFFGHNLHPWGAFTVKPFMPTVFGEGKVAQFSTFSYPYWGYGLLVIIFLCLMLAFLIRRKQLRENRVE